jgi:hypothetical protein
LAFCAALVLFAVFVSVAWWCRIVSVVVAAV